MPGAIDNVICVAATDQADGLAGFSDYGATSVDLGAPGTETLSTYPGQETPISDDFEADDFSSHWTSGGAGFGRAASGDGPLTSFGMNDSPGGAPAPSSIHEVTLTTGGALAAGAGACTLSGKRYRSGGSGGTFFYQVLGDNVPAFTNTASTTSPSFAMEPFNTVPIEGLAGHAVKLRFGFIAGPTPTAANGIWFDDSRTELLRAAQRSAELRIPPGHLDGRAARDRRRRAAVLAATGRDRDRSTRRLLAGVDADPSAGWPETTSGGRLDVAKALDSLEGKVVDNVAPSKPILSGTVPGSRANDNNPKIVGSAEAGRP